MTGKLSHYDEKGEARMVDVSAKASNLRTATAHAFVKIRPEVLAKLPENPKGDPLAVARICVEEIGLGVRSTICALMHDTVEDTDVTLELVFMKSTKTLDDALVRLQ